MQKKLIGTIVGLCVTIAGCLLLFAGSVCAFGQETRASLGGRVTDAQGAVIQNAVVAVTSDDTRVVQTTKTNNVGEWRIQFLLPGFYHFDVSAKGFMTETRPGLELQVNAVLTVDTQMRVGSQAESVTVEATNPLIDTTAAVAGTVITSTEMVELPSLSNAPTMLSGMTPGVTTSTGVGGGVYLWSNSGLSGNAINGTGAVASATEYTNAATNYTLDGGVDTNNDAQIAFEPPSDAVSQFKVVTNAYDAAMGRQSGGTIALISKTGTLAFHGDAYLSNQNNFLNANSYQYDATGTPKAPLHTNNYGGTFGGPLWIPKFGAKDPLSYDGRKKGTFFFFSYSGIRNVAPVNAGFATVPDAAERNGDFSASYTVSAGVTYPINIYDPNTVVPTTPGNFARTEFGSGCKGTYPQPSTCNVIPTNRIDPIAKAIWGLLPLPDAPAQTTSSNDANNYVKTEEQNDKFEGYMLRVDHAWNNSNHSYVNLRQNHWDEITNDPFGPTFYLNEYLQARLNKGITIDHTVILNKDFLLDVNYNALRYLSATQSASAGRNPTFLGFPSSYISQMQVASIPLFENIVPGAENDGLGTEQNSNPAVADTNQDFNGSVTETFRNHSIRYGAEYLIQQEAVDALGASGGEFTFGTNWTKSSPVGTVATGSGDMLADFELGLPNGGSIPNNASAFWSQHYMAYYVQDDWRTTQKLTLNIGLRWDYQRPVTERFNRFASRFDPNYVITGVTSVAQPNYATLIAGSSANNTGLALLQAQRPNASTFIAKGGLLYAGLNGTSRYVENGIKKYYQPRFGFAYQLRPDLVIRGGLGRFVQASYNTGSQTGYSQTTSLTATTNNYESAPTISLENPYPAGLLTTIGNSQGELTNVGSEGSYTDPNNGRRHVDEASMSVQQQVKGYLFEAGFVLSKTRGMGMSWERNDPSAAAWHAAYDPQFTSTGAPVLTSAASTTVNNPFYHVAGIQTSLSDYTSSTIGAYSLLRPNPILGNLTVSEATGQNTYYALNTKVERRLRNGFSILQSFSWSKNENAQSFLGPQVAKAIIWRQLSSVDQRFHDVVAPVYELPFGRGKLIGDHVNRLTDELIGGWEFVGEYQFQSGTPLDLPTNTNSGEGNSGFFQGGSPSLGSKKTSGQWFNTSMFAPIPTSSTTQAQLAAYPSWTGVQGMPGAGWTPTPGVTGYSKIANGIYNDFATRVTYNQQYFGNIRNPYTNTFTLGARKSFAISESVRFQLGMDAFNALNHPQFGNIDVNPSDTYFGAISGSAPGSWVQVNSPRSIQLRGRLTF
jgi:hypothetical protein